MIDSRSIVSFGYITDNIGPSVVTVGYLQEWVVPPALPITLPVIIDPVSIITFGNLAESRSIALSHVSFGYMNYGLVILPTPPVPPVPPSPVPVMEQPMIGGYGSLRRKIRRSSFIEGYHYDSERGILSMTFKGGYRGIYLVSERLFEEFDNAPSLGKFFHKYIKQKSIKRSH